jgi:cystathionine beta-lyase/cystathionine gamma-synthase
MIWVETPTNPLMKLLRNYNYFQEKYTSSCRHLLPPYLQRPLDLGADVVMHSGNKVLSRTL